MPLLSSYYQAPAFKVLTFVDKPKDLYAYRSADLNGDGHEDLLALGAYYPVGPIANWSAQPGNVLFGDGNGNFTPATAAQFPLATLKTVHPRNVLFADFNGDGRTDFFIAAHGYDQGPSPLPSEQNQLWLSRADGSFVDATSTLPQLLDYTHSATAGDIDNDGDIDIFVGNGYDSPSHVLAYTLMNDGKGNFTKNSTNVPAYAGSVLDFQTVHHFPGSRLADLDGDHLPELIITADAGNGFDKLTKNTILWNRNGAFSETGMTELPVPAGLPGHITLDVQAMDVNRDGRMDLVVLGTNGRPYYDGSFVQVLRNDGGNVFTDVTASVMPAADIRTAVDGAATGKAWGMFLKVFDFNGDGTLDFAAEYNGQLTQATPLVWLGNGTGGFNVLHVSDFVAPGEEWQIAGSHFYQTANGWSILATQGHSDGIIVTGLVATQAYKGQAAASVFTGTGNNDQFANTAAADTFDGGAGRDTVLMAGPRADYTVTKTDTGYTVADKAAGVTDTLTGIERVKFADVSLAFDVDGAAGQTYRIYQAAFGRTPDAGGLSAWLGAMDAGYLNLNSLAAEFVKSVEFKDQYKNALTNQAVVEQFYRNVLHREGEAAGVAAWTSVLDHQFDTVAGVLASFADGAENKAALVGVLSLGIAYNA